MQYNTQFLHALPLTQRCPMAFAVDGLLLDTVHWYCPPSLPVTVRVWVYCAVAGSSNTVIPPETVSESLVQVTVVAGPPVEIQVRVTLTTECHTTWYGDITCNTESIDCTRIPLHVYTHLHYTVSHVVVSEVSSLWTALVSIVQQYIPDVSPLFV